MKLFFLVLLCFVFLLLGAYFGWALHRISPSVLMDDGAWPKPWPYPDSWLLKLNNRYDAIYPAPPGCIKIHGEIPRVRFTLFLFSETFLILGTGYLVGLILIALRSRSGKPKKL